MGEIRIPGGIGFEHGVEDDKELAHAGDDDDLELFALGFETLCEGPNDGVTAFGGKSGHIEHGSNGGAAAPDGAFSLKSSAVAIERSQAGQGADLLAVEGSQFGKFCQERSGGDGAHARSAPQQIDFSAPFVIGFETFQQIFLDPLNLTVQDIDQALDALADRGCRCGLQAIGLGSPVIDELSPASNKLLKFRVFFRSFRENSRSNVLTEPCDHGGIDPVGLGQDPQAAGEIADLARIDDGNVVPGIEQVGDQAPLIPAGGFDDDQTTLGIWQLHVQSLQAARAVSDREGLLLGKDANVERVLGDIDADEQTDLTVHGFVPVLQMRARDGRRPSPALATVRALSTKPATIMLCDGLTGPRRNRSVAGRSGKSCSATLRSSSHCTVNLTI